jgi:hypothetical protein
MRICICACKCHNRQVLILSGDKIALQSTWLDQPGHKTGASTDIEIRYPNEVRIEKNNAAAWAMLHRVFGPNGNNRYTDQKGGLENGHNYGRLLAKYMHT